MANINKPAILIAFLALWCLSAATPSLNPELGLKMSNLDEVSIHKYILS